MTQWQPIDTIPYDKPVWIIHIGNPVTINIGLWYDCDYKEFLDLHKSELNGHPTHWMDPIWPDDGITSPEEDDTNDK